MGQFTVYENKNSKTKQTYPYLIEVQSDLLAELRTTVVIPLCEASKIADAMIAKLCPVVKIAGQRFVAVTPQLAGIDRNQLGKEVTNLAEHRSDFIAALDLLISGF